MKKQDYESSWRILSYPQLKPKWICVSGSTGTRVNPTQVCCGTERVCKFLPLVPSALRMTTKWAKPDKNPAARSLLAVCHWCSSCGSSLWLENFADSSAFLQLSLQPWKQSEINFYRALKGSWTKPFDMALNISLCLNEFSLAVRRENAWCWFLQLLAWLAADKPNDGMLITFGCRAGAVLPSDGRAGAEQRSCLSQCRSLWVDPADRIDVSAGNPATGWIVIEKEGNIPSWFISFCLAWLLPSLWNGLFFVLGLVLLVLPTLPHCSGSIRSRRQSFGFNFSAVPPLSLLFLCVSISTFKSGNCVSWGLVQTPTHSLDFTRKHPRFKEF